MTYMRRLRFGLAVLSCAPFCAFSQSALVHMQGEPGTREAYFVDFAVVLDRTPADKLLGPLMVRQLDTTVVYESAEKPEFGSLRLQFECVVKHPFDGKNTPKQPAFDAPVRVRVGEGSWKLRREDLKNESLPAGEWRTSTSTVLLKLHKIACNDDVIRSAMVKAAKDKSDLTAFGREIAKLGLPADLRLLGQQTAPEYLDFAWWVLWSGAKRPDPTGKWSRRPTRQELADARAEMARIQRQYDELAGLVKPALEENVRRMDAQFAFERAAAEIRGNREMSRNERLMLTAWEAKSETEVAATMGAPISSSAGRLRFMSYGREFDNRVVVGNSKGAVWEEGFYESCNVQFVLHADTKGVFRVADVRIWTGSTQFGQIVYACGGLLEAPR